VDSKRSKLYTYIGFAARAGKIIFGDYTVEQHLKNKKLRVVILDHVSEATCNKYKVFCEKNGAACIIISETMEQLNISGKTNKIFGLKDRQFSDLIINEYKNTALKAGVD